MVHNSSPPAYWLTRFVILRLLGFVYEAAFLVAVNQLLPLMGSHGLLPAVEFIRRVSDNIGPTSAFLHLPSLFWWIHPDTALMTAAWVGLLLSCVVLAGFAKAPMLFILWFLYMSIINIGQEWYGYGWEIQIPDEYPWTLTLIGKLLHNDPDALSLLPCPRTIFLSRFSKFCRDSPNFVAIICIYGQATGNRNRIRYSPCPPGALS